MNESYPFKLPPLPYRYNDLSPYIDEKTIRVHHDTLFQGYVTRLNNALKMYPRFQNWSLERLILQNKRLPQDIQTVVYNNAGGVYNHTVYFDSMTPNYRRPSNFMMRMIEKSFGTYDNFINQMLTAGLSVFGSGWAWLVSDGGDKLKIVTTKNQDTPLPNGQFPILPLDVWEHSYFLQYLSDRGNYIMNWSNIINWKYVEERIRNMDRKEMM